MASLRHIMNPIEIGPISVPNRVTRTGHGTGIGAGTMNDALINYHLAAARGGVGLTIIEALAVHSSAYPFLIAGAPGLVDGYRKLMEAVKPHGMRVFQQIGHLGNEIMQADGSPPWSSSDSVGAFVGVPAEPMSKQQIREYIECCVEAALDCQRGGLDGVELHMAHGYLLQQFLSPLYNDRIDEYGGSEENRFRFALELVETVRRVLPASMALGVRLSSEVLPGGMGPGEVLKIAGILEDRGLVDYINLSLGTDYNPHKIIAAMHEPTGYELVFDAPVKRRLRLPVLVAGRFRTLEEADRVIAQGEADLVGMTRAHIADPDLVRKTLAGRVEEVRPCLGCNHGCIGGLLTMGRIGCTVNVAVGQEATLAEHLIRPSANPRRVLIVGGGPAGMEAARVAALGGHRVILCEGTNELGGCVAIAKRAPRRLGIGDITDWQSRELDRLGVEIRFGAYIEAGDVAALAPDILIVATGSTPRSDGRQMFTPKEYADGMDRPNVLSSHDLLLAPKDRDFGRRALVFDDPGHYEGIAAAESLLARGVSVTYATGHPSFAPKLAASLSAEPALERLAKGDFRLMTYAKLLGVRDQSAVLAHRYGGPPIEVEADTVIFVSHNAPNRELLDLLGEFKGPVIPVGDVRSPRYLQVAIREGHMAGRSIDARMASTPPQDRHPPAR
jgi:2,4-dienoyl-CoA reductase-like NADH-dependent reductase (Old Yellow Enzyme family)